MSIRSASIEELKWRSLNILGVCYLVFRCPTNCFSLILTRSLMSFGQGKNMPGCFGGLSMGEMDDGIYG